MRAFIIAAAAVLVAAPGAQALIQNGFGYSLSVVDTRDTRFNFDVDGLVEDDSGFLRADLTNERQRRTNFNAFPDPALDPAADTNLGAAVAGQGGFGVLRASAYLRYSLATGDFGRRAAARPFSFDEFIIEASDPLLDGTRGTATAKMLVTGGVTASFDGEIPEGAELPGVGYGARLQKYNGTNINNVPSTDLFNDDPDVVGNFDGDVAGLARGVSGTFDFTYGEAFTLRSELGAGGVASNRDGGFNLVTVSQELSANFLGTGVLGFVLPQGAALAAGSGAAYRQAFDEGALDLLLAGEPGGGGEGSAEVPLPAGAPLLALGLAALTATRRRRRG